MYLRKTLVLILTILFLLSFTGGVMAKEPVNPNLKFEFNNDLTKVTINGVTCDNIMYVKYFPYDSNKLYLENIFTNILVIPFEANRNPVKSLEGYRESLHNKVSVELRPGQEQLELQLVLVNYKPWLETEFSERYFDKIKTFNRPDIEANITKIKNGELISSLEDVKDLPIMVREYDLARNMEEFKKASSEWITLEGANVYNLQEYIKNFSLSGEKEENIVPQIILQLDNKEIKVGEKTSELDVAPYNPSGTTLIPVRGVLEALNATVEWLPDNQQVKINDNTNEIVLTINSPTALVNGKTVNLLEPATILDDRTFLPLRFVSENLGYNVQWLPETKQIIIN